ncbi:hypothetical protein ROA7450_03110 [Roseovarius albus]|uniref:Uncharacterized protein n=2 Tax=Roseovarius albus TaxID=1247867 RepID=A0A1X6ZS38_9RHOB|nr:hypothetical protein ROA7450_03110 [Roseovarius albus]
MRNRVGNNQDQLTQSRVFSGHQIREVVLIFAICILALSAVVAFGHLTGTKISHLTKDPLVVTKGRVYLGMQSNFGVLIWWSGAVIGLFTALLLRQRLASSFLFHLSLFTAFLTLDDMFMFHERIWPSITGLSETRLFLVYFLWATLIFFLGRKDIVRAPVLSLIVSVVFFALSVGLDRLPNSQLQTLFEDGAKFIGQVFWTLFIIRTALSHFEKTEQKMLVR